MPRWCPYKLLGVSHLAYDDEIQKAFDDFKKIFDDKKEAYKMLIDPNRRRAFERERANKKEKENKVFPPIYIKYLIKLLETKAQD